MNCLWILRDPLSEPTASEHIAMLVADQDWSEVAKFGGVVANRRLNIDLSRGVLKPKDCFKGYDVWIIASSTEDEAAAKQKVFDALFDGLHTESGRPVMVLSVSIGSATTAGQTLGLGYAWRQAKRLAKGRGISDLSEEVRSGRLKVVMLPDAGMAERFSPMTQGLGNSRGRQKLVGTCTNACGRVFDLELIIAVALNVAPFSATNPGGRVDVFWTSQLTFGTIPHFEIRRRNAPFDKFIVFLDRSIFASHTSTNQQTRYLYEFGTAMMDKNG